MVLSTDCWRRGIGKLFLLTLDLLETDQSANPMGTIISLFRDRTIRDCTGLRHMASDTRNFLRVRITALHGFLAGYYRLPDLLAIIPTRILLPSHTQKERFAEQAVRPNRPPRAQLNS